MICFELSVNDKKLTTAGVPGDGTLTQTVAWVRRPGDAHDGLYLTLSGHETHADVMAQAHVDWGRVNLKVGDVVTLRIVEGGTVDAPQSRKSNPEARAERRVAHMREELEQLEHVITVSVLRGASIKPPGDVVTVHVLNRGADQVMSLADAARKGGQVSVSTSELSSIVDPEHERKIANDVDEALWEEAETGLRHQSQITANYLGLMALGGAVAATGLVVESTPQAISVIAAAIIAPGFDPLAKIPMGMALRRWDVARAGLVSAAIGYLALILSAALVFLVLRWSGVTTVEEFVGNSQVQELAEPTLREILLSACGAVAGMIMMLSYRRFLIPGALVALMIIEAAAMVGMALAAGTPALMYEGLERFGLDVLLIVLGGVLVVLLKQTIFHRRAPMV